MNETRSSAAQGMFSVTDLFMRQEVEARSAPMLVAASSFECDYDGQHQHIIAGVTRIAADHEIVRRHPGRFRRTGSSAGWPVTRVTQADDFDEFERFLAIAKADENIRKIEQLREVPPFVEVPASGRVQIRIGPDTLARLKGCARLSADGKESGGFLYGRMHNLDRFADRSIQVDAVMSMGPDAIRRWNRVELDANHSLDGQALIGCWHTHPVSIDDWRSGPSNGDRNSWLLNSLDLREGDPWLGLIVTPDVDGSWIRSEARGWVVRRNLSGEAICEPATVVVG